jgi:LysR family hydrogen peroxide-inducible transcriptional activator
MPNDLTLKQLNYFVALAETHHYRKAAERVGVSQPSLSQQIIGLESALGLELVERGRRGAVLTPGGREVFEQARKVLEEASALHAVVENMRQGVNGTIRLGSTPTLGPYFLPYVLRALNRSYPSLKVIVREGAPLILQDELLAGQHDLLLTQLPIRSADTVQKRLFREPLKLCMASNSSLARLGCISDADLRDQEILTLSDTYLLHDQIAGLSQEVGASLRQDYEGTSLDALRRMTALNMGIAFLPALYVQSEISSDNGDVAVRPFRRDRFTRSIGLVWRRQSAHLGLVNRMADVFRSVARQKFKGSVTVES